MGRTEAQKRAQQKYLQKKEVKARLKVIALKCHIEHDADILERIESRGVGNKSTYLKDLIREDIKRNG